MVVTLYARSVEIHQVWTTISWAAYALCDLEPPYRVHARFIGAVGGEQAGAVVLMSTAASYVPVRQGPGYLPEMRSQRMENRAAGTGCRCIQGAHRREWQQAGPDESVALPS